MFLFRRADEIHSRLEQDDPWDVNINILGGSERDSCKPCSTNREAGSEFGCWQKLGKRRMAVVIVPCFVIGILTTCPSAGKEAGAASLEMVQLVGAPQCAARGAGCMQSKCCQESGMQCYTKSGEWATCLPECISGVHSNDPEPTTWNCEKVGNRTAGSPPMDYWGGLKAAAWVETRCSANGDDCSKTGCCKESGMTCFSKK